MCFNIFKSTLTKCIKKASVFLLIIIFFLTIPHALQQQKIHLLECPTCSSSFRCHLSEAVPPPPIQRKEKKEKKEACRAINVKALKPFVNLVD